MPIFWIFWHLLVAKKVGRQDITDDVSSSLALSNKYMSVGLVFLEMFREGGGGAKLTPHPHKKLPSKSPALSELIYYLEMKWPMNSCEFCVTSRNFDYMLSTFIEVITCTYCIIYMAWHCNTGSRDN